MTAPKKPATAKKAPAQTEEKPKRAAIDWEAIEIHYRAGIRSLKDIGAEYGVSDAGIIKRAKRDGWERQPRERTITKVQLRQTAPAEKPRAGFLYVIYVDAPERFYKIGMAQTFSERFGAHQCASPFGVFVACAYFVGDMRAEERHLHAKFDAQRVRGEWFRLTPEDLRGIAERALLV